MPEKNFYEELGYSLPDEVGEVKAEGGFEYYNHPVGIYQGVFGRLEAKYKDLNGEKCDDTTPGAQLSYFVLRIFLRKYLGTANNPENKQILGHKDKFLIPAGAKAAELYFPITVSYNAKDQWKVQKMFEKFSIPGNENLRIAKQNPAKPTERITDFRAFPAYYGMNVKLVLESGKKTGRSFCSSIELVGTDRVEPETMMELEKDIDALIRREIEERQSAGSSPQIPEAPAPSADALFDEEELGDFTTT